METKEVLQEGASINKSLLALTNCINILSSNKNCKGTNTARFIPYRNSKLTRLLKDSLGGGTPVAMIVCLSPNSIYLEETLNSVKYAQKAMNIKVNYKRSNHSSKSYRGFLGSIKTNGRDSANQASERNWMMREAYEKRINDLEKECRYWRTLRERTMTERSLQPTGRSAAMTSKREKYQELEKAFSTPPLESKEDEFYELIQALVENVEDENLLKQNVLELDELIRQNDEDINEIQRHIEECKGTEIMTELYNELKFLADRLEENLDLKEEAIQEADMLRNTIECTKLGLTKMYKERVKKVSDVNNKQSDSKLKKKIMELSNQNAELTSALNSLVGEDNVQDLLLKRKEKKSGQVRRVFKELDDNIEGKEEIFDPKAMKSAKMDDVMNLLLCKFKPKSEMRTIISPLEFTKEMKSENKTLIYSDSGRDDIKTLTNRKDLKSTRRGEVGLEGLENGKDNRFFGNYVQSGRCTDDTNTNPMSLISSTSRRYVSNGSKMSMI